MRLTRLAHLLNPFGGVGGVAPVTTYPDLVAAVAARLRATPGVMTPLGGETAGRPKIFSGTALGSPALPYLVIERPAWTYQYLSEGNFIARGELEISLHAAGSIPLQTLSDAVTKGEPGDPPGALDDPPLLFRGGRLMKFRLARPAWDEPTTPGVGAAAAYHRILPFSVWFSGSIR